MTRMPSRFSDWSVLLPLILLLCLLSPPAHTDGGYYYTAIGDSEASKDAMGAQRALFLQTPEAMEMILQSSYRGTADDFAWVLPLPAVPRAVADEPVETLDQLEGGTRPLFVVVQDNSRIIDDDGCEPFDGDVPDGGEMTAEGGQSDVSVVLEGELEFLDYVVLDARTGQGLSDWLAENGYVQPEGSAAILADYLARDFVFFAAKLNIDASSANEMKGLPAVRFTFERDVQPVYPMKLTALSAGKSVRVLIMAASVLGVIEPDPALDVKWMPLPETLCSAEDYSEWLGNLWGRPGKPVMVAEMIMHSFGNVGTGALRQDYPYYGETFIKRDCPHVTDMSDEFWNSCYYRLQPPSDTILSLLTYTDANNPEDLQYHFSRFLGQFRPDQMSDDIYLHVLSDTAIEQTGVITHRNGDYIGSPVCSIPTYDDEIDPADPAVGDTRCSENIVTIFDGADWTHGYICATGKCLGKSCGCEDGAKRCADNRLLVCENGSWRIQENCDLHCFEPRVGGNAVCSDCQFGDRKVENGKGYFCTGADWVDGSPCKDDGKRYCDESYSQRDELLFGKRYYYCLGGNWTTSSCGTGEYCRAGECVPYEGCEDGGSVGCFSDGKTTVSIMCDWQSDWPSWQRSRGCYHNKCDAGICLLQCGKYSYYGYGNVGERSCINPSIDRSISYYAECDGYYWRKIDDCTGGKCSAEYGGCKAADWVEPDPCAEDGDWIYDGDLPSDGDTPSDGDLPSDDDLPSDGDLPDGDTPSDGDSPGASSQTDAAADSGCAQSPNAAGWGWLLLILVGVMAWRRKHAVRLLATLGLALIALGASSSPAHADGGYYYTTVTDSEESRDAMGAQRALFLQTPEAMEMILQSSYRGTADDFAWVLPLPAVPKAVADEPVETLDQLESITRPIFLQLEEHYDPDGDCYDCDGDTPDGDMVVGDIEQSGVTVVLEGELEFLDYVILDSSTGHGLAKWLDDNGYIQPEGSAAILADYLERDFVFFAAKLNINATSENEMQGLPAVRFTFDLDVQPVYPMKLTALSAVEPVRVLIMAASIYGLLEPDPDYSAKWIPIAWINCAESYTRWLEKLWDLSNDPIFVGEYMRHSSHHLDDWLYAEESGKVVVNRDCSGEDVAECSMVIDEPSEILKNLSLPMVLPSVGAVANNYIFTRYISEFRPAQMGEDIHLTAASASGDISGVSVNYVYGDELHCPVPDMPSVEEIGLRYCDSYGYVVDYSGNGTYPGTIYYCGYGFCEQGRCMCDASRARIPAYCHDEYLLTCQQGRLAISEACEIDCFSGECSDCQYREQRCVGDTVESCDEPNEWRQRWTCPEFEMCRDGECRCKYNGQILCDHGPLSSYYICKDGNWESQDQLNSYCVNGEVFPIEECRQSSVVCVTIEGDLYSKNCETWQYEECDSGRCVDGLCMEACLASYEGDTDCRRWGFDRYNESYVRCDGQFWQLVETCKEAEDCTSEGCMGTQDGASSQADDDADSGCAQSPNAAGWGWLLLFMVFELSRRKRRHPMSR